MTEEWSRADFARELAARDRVLVLFYAGAWCPFSHAFLPHFEAAEPEASMPFASADIRHPMDPRWDEYRVLTTPTLVYFEHGEELERLEGVRWKGISRRDFEEFLAEIEAIQPEPALPKRMHGTRRT